MKKFGHDLGKILFCMLAAYSTLAMDREIFLDNFGTFRDNKDVCLVQRDRFGAPSTTFWGRSSLLFPVVVL